MITMHPVKSSNIAQIGYDAAAKELYVRFHSGHTHAYANVLPAKHEAIIAAPSIGSYFHQHVRDKHQHRKVTT